MKILCTYKLKWALHSLTIDGSFTNIPLFSVFYSISFQIEWKFLSIILLQVPCIVNYLSLIKLKTSLFDWIFSFWCLYPFSQPLTLWVHPECLSENFTLHFTLAIQIVFGSNISLKSGITEYLSYYLTNSFAFAVWFLFYVW